MKLSGAEIICVPVIFIIVKKQSQLSISMKHETKLLSLPDCAVSCTGSGKVIYATTSTRRGRKLWLVGVTEDSVKLFANSKLVSQGRRTVVVRIPLEIFRDSRE